MGKLFAQCLDTSFITSGDLPPSLLESLSNLEHGGFTHLTRFFDGSNQIFDLIGGDARVGELGKVIECDIFTSSQFKECEEVGSLEVGVGEKSFDGFEVELGGEVGGVFESFFVGVDPFDGASFKF